MKYTFIFSVFVLFTCQNCATTPVKSERPVFASIANIGKGNAVVNDAMARTVIISSASGVCTGFIVKTGFVLTAGHCYRGETLYVDGKVVKVVKSGDPFKGETDLALLTVDTAEFPLIQLGEPTIGESVVMVANQNIFRNIVFFGSVMHVTESHLMSNIVIIPGASGAAVLSADGKLLGVCVQLLNHVDPKRAISEMIGSYAVNSKKIADFAVGI